jgi:hypothetical protein
MLRYKCFILQVHDRKVAVIATVLDTVEFITLTYVQNVKKIYASFHEDIPEYCESDAKN